MKPLRLHTKTTLLVSAITLAVFLATLLLVSVRMVNLVREDEKELARLQAFSVAEQISLMPTPRDQDDLDRAVSQARAASPNVIAVRVWQQVGDGFVERAASSDGSPAEAAPLQEISASLREGAGTKGARALRDFTLEKQREIHYRVFAPVTAQGRFDGLVEVTERLDNVPSIVRRFAETAALLAFVALVLATLAIYALFRHLVYHPMRRLLYAMARAKAGSLTVQLPVAARDEFGRLALGFNRMIERLRALTAERAAQQETLRQRVNEATAELQERNAQLAETNRELYQTARRLTQMERLAAAGQTAAQFAHEIGTPLNSISIHLELLRAATETNPAAARRTTIISEQLERIERIVRRMLDRTRLEEAVLQPLALAPLLEQVCEATGPTLQMRRVRLVKAFEERLPPIAGNADHLQQVFFNLINNSLDAMPDGGELQLRTTRASDHVLVEFKDTGCGMDAETQARIFDPLYTTKEQGHGTGLGLVVAQQVMEEHCGSITVESSLGCGASFRLSFPVATLADTTQAAEAIVAR
jgi:signal transduction histidine kinase